jgi:3',5'-cyclic AMP phosphodiesterase CpdA
MQRILVSLGVAAVILAAAALSRTDTRTPASSNGLVVQVDRANPWNHLKLNNDPETFRFAIVTDRTGGARAGVFERAVEQINILQPEFVVSVGDLIQGTDDAVKMSKQWQEFNGFISKLQMPFFYVPGNHDIGNQLMDQKWRQQFGRSYYHFLYKDVLFLLLNTEDPPKTKSGSMSKEQVAYAEKVLKENAGVRWTLVFLHRPVWTQADVAKTGWLEVEKALAGRHYTVFAGHKHIYQRFIRQGQKYYMLATTGGGSKLRGLPFGEFDHLMWVTMKKDGPVLANLMTEGIFADELPAITIPQTGVKAPLP